MNDLTKEIVFYIKLQVNEVLPLFNVTPGIFRAGDHLDNYFGLVKQVYIT